LNLVTRTGRTGASANLELVDMFCCLHVDDILSADGDADAAVEASIRIE